MKTRSEVFQFEKELKWEHPAPGIRRQIICLLYTSPSPRDCS